MGLLFTSINSSSPIIVEVSTVSLFSMYNNCINLLLQMKKAQIGKSGSNLQSYRSLTKHRGTNLENRVQTLSKQLITNGDKHILQEGPHNQIHKINKPQNELMKKIRTLERQLKRKLCQNTIISRFFKTKNSSDLSHIDIYIKMLENQEALRETQKNCQKYKQNQQNALNKVAELVEQLEKQEIQHMQEIENISMNISKIEKKHYGNLQQKDKILTQGKNKLVEEIHRNTLLIQELQNKNRDLATKNQVLKEEIDKMQYVHQLALLKDKERIVQIENLKDQLQKSLVRLGEEEANRQELEESYSNNLNSMMVRHEKEIGDLKANYQDQISALEHTIKQLQEQMEQENNNRSASKHQEIQRIRGQYQVQINNFKFIHNKEIQQSKKTLQTLQENIRQRQSLAQVIEAKNKQLRLEVERVMKQQQQLKSKYDESQISLRSSKAAYEQCHKQGIEKQTTIERLIKEVSHLEQQFMQRQNQTKILRYSKHEADGLKGRWQGMKTANEETIRRLQNRIYELQISNNKLQNKLLEQRQKIEIMREQKIQNNKNKNENYKAIGRLLQLNNKIYYYTKQYYNHQDDNLNNVITLLAHNIDLFINQVYNKIKNQFKTLYHLFNQLVCLSQSLKLNQFLEELNLCKENKRITIMEKMINEILKIKAAKYYSVQNNRYIRKSLQSTMSNHKNQIPQDPIIKAYQSYPRLTSPRKIHHKQQNLNSNPKIKYNSKNKENNFNSNNMRTLNGPKEKIINKECSMDNIRKKYFM